MLPIGESKYGFGFGFGVFRCVAMDRTGGLLSRGQYGPTLDNCLRIGVLVSGILSPLASLFLYVLVYSILTRTSTDHEEDWLLRLSLSTVAMTVPFVVTLALAIKDVSLHGLSLFGKIGLAIAFFSLLLVWNPVSDGLKRWSSPET